MLRRASHAFPVRPQPVPGERPAPVDSRSNDRWVQCCGPEQERLNNVFGARPHITALRPPPQAASPLLVQPLKILYGPLMFLSVFPRGERPQVPALTRLRILLPRIKPILPRFELPNHTLPNANGLPFGPQCPQWSRVSCQKNRRSANKSTSHRHFSVVWQLPTGLRRHTTAGKGSGAGRFPDRDGASIRAASLCAWRCAAIPIPMFQAGVQRFENRLPH
jgi:hypothetical protein